MSAKKSFVVLLVVLAVLFACFLGLQSNEDAELVAKCSDACSALDHDSSAVKDGRCFCYLDVEE